VVHFFPSNISVEASQNDPTQVVMTVLVRGTASVMNLAAAAGGNQRSTDQQDVEVTRGTIVSVGGVDRDGWCHEGRVHGGGNVVEYHLLGWGDIVHHAELAGEVSDELGWEVSEAVDAGYVGEVSVPHYNSNI